MRWFVVNPGTGMRLCKDNKWRDFAMFGTYRSCVKFYKRQINAQKVANRIRGKVSMLADNESMDASGRITACV